MSPTRFVLTRECWVGAFISTSGGDDQFLLVVLGLAIYIVETHQIDQEDCYRIHAAVDEALVLRRHRKAIAANSMIARADDMLVPTEQRGFVTASCAIVVWIPICLEISYYYKRCREHVMHVLEKVQRRAAILDLW